MSGLRALSPLEIIRSGKWQSAFFTTYALSLGFFEGVVLPSLQRSGTQDIAILADVEGVVGALGEAGARHVGRAYMVAPVRVTPGVFHPKLGILLGDRECHLLVGSGNLTFGGWGHNIELLEHISSTEHPVAFRDAADFLRNLSVVERVTMGAERELHARIVGLDSAAGDAAEGRLRLLHNLSRSIADQLVQYANSFGGAERLTVVSPYFGGPAAVQMLMANLGLDRVEVHVGNNLAINGQHFAFGSSTFADAVIVEELRGKGKSDRPLHAKLIEIDCRQARLILSGSVNASRPALTELGNVELGVLRVVEDRQVFARSVFSGALPDLPPSADEAEGGHVKGAVQATYAAGVLQGHVLFADPAGQWDASLHMGDVWEALGSIVVGASAKFEVETTLLDKAMFRGQRSVIMLTRGSDRIRGFISFPDLLSAARRLGTIAAPLLRLTGDADDDEDWLVVLEWFARNPEQTIAPWRKSSVRGPKPDRQDIEVSVKALIPQLDQATTIYHDVPGHSDAIDRLLNRLRIVIGDPIKPTGSGHATDSDDVGDERATKKAALRRQKLSAGIEKLFEVLSGRVPADPVPELYRLAEIGIFWLLRHSDEPERSMDFLNNWISLSGQHLRRGTADEDFENLATSLICFDAVSRNSPGSARKRLIDLFGTERMASQKRPYHYEDLHNPALQRLAGITFGRERWDATVNAITSSRISLDDVHAATAALREGSPPSKPVSAAAAKEWAQLYSLFERGRLDLIHVRPRTTTACPKHSRRIPESFQEQFRQSGIVGLECCNGIMLRSDT